jgi:DNA-binding transcriptional LysR family regulator
MAKNILKANNIEIQDFASIIELNNSQSFSKAAEKLNKSQSALSQQIAKLEQNLGSVLIDRDNSNKLTEKGEQLLVFARQIMQLHQEALSCFVNPSLSGEIFFGLPEDFATVFLSDILAELNLKYPHVHVNVECDLTLNLLKRFNRKHFDLVLIKTTSLDDFPDQNEIDVWDEKLVWVAKKNTNLVIDKKNIPLVLSPKPCVYRHRALDSLEEKKLKYKVVYTSPSFIGATAAVKADMGITVLPQNMIPEGLEVYENEILPDLKSTHISFLIKDEAPTSARWFADFVLTKLTEEN